MSRTFTITSSDASVIDSVITLLRELIQERVLPENQLPRIRYILSGLQDIAPRMLETLSDAKEG